VSLVNAHVILPGQTIGILGGGQLGRMIALAARAMGYRIAVLDPSPDCPAAGVADVVITAAYDDVEAAQRLAASSDVITYEFENVNRDVTALLEAKAYVPQGSQLLAISQHRIREKTALSDMGVSIASFSVASTRAELITAAHDLGFPCVCKTTMGGYDGKGQWLFRSPADIAEMWDSHPAHDEPFIVESFVPFVMELSVVVARSPRGEVVTFPVAENIHKHHILHQSIVPARTTLEIQAQSKSIAVRIAESLNAIGLLAVELFLTADGTIYVNEIAPRPHNSGHFTMDACQTSQFEQHVRAICNLPLTGTALLTPVVMVNILGQQLNQVLQQTAELPSSMHVHLYGKADAKENRKMGHLNVQCGDVVEGIREIERLQIWNL